MDIPSILLGAAGVLTTLAALGILNWKRTPPWADQLSTSWSSVNLYAMGAGTVSGVIAMLPVIVSGISPLGAFSTCLGTTALGYCLAQACFTDPPLHLVDRYTLSLTACLSLLASFAYLYNSGDKVILGGFMAFSLAAGALILLPLGIGASDGRAFLLSMAASFPLLGFELIKYPLIAMFICFLLYGVWSKVRGRGGESLGKALVSRTHIPAVPFILAPFLLANFAVMLWSTFDH